MKLERQMRKGRENKKPSPLSTKMKSFIIMAAYLQDFDKKSPEELMSVAIDLLGKVDTSRLNHKHVARIREYCLKYNLEDFLG